MANQEQIDELRLILETIPLLAEDRFVLLNIASRMPDDELGLATQSIGEDSEWIFSLLKTFYATRLAELQGNSALLKKNVGEVLKSV